MKQLKVHLTQRMDESLMWIGNCKYMYMDTIGTDQNIAFSGYK